jgi:hypothetical protein
MDGMAFQRSMAVLWFHLLGERAPGGATQTDLKAALVRASRQPVVVLDEFFARYHTVQSNSQANIAYANDNVPLMVCQLLRCLRVCFVIMGTQTRIMNAFMRSDESAGKKNRPFLYLVMRLPEVPLYEAQLALDVVEACGSEFTDAIPVLTYLLQRVRPHVHRYVRKELQRGRFSHVTAAYKMRVATLREEQVSASGLVLDAMRQVIARPYVSVDGGHDRRAGRALADALGGVTSHEGGRQPLPASPLLRQPPRRPLERLLLSAGPCQHCESRR